MIKNRYNSLIAKYRVGKKQKEEDPKKYNDDDVDADDDVVDVRGQ